MTKIQKIQTSQYNNRYAISDIHGCFLTFQKLVEEGINLQKEDCLFLLGDYVDRGPRTKEVLDYILALQSEGYAIFPLRGNHEQDLLDVGKEYNPRMYKVFVELFNKNKGILNEDSMLIEKYKTFIENLPYLYEIEDFYLVHAGLNLYKEDYLSDFGAMIRIRKMPFSGEDLDRLKGKRIIHGHQVTELPIIKEGVNNKAKVIALDNGCVYTKRYKKYDYQKLGNLCALNLDTFELIVQGNIDQKIKL